MVQKVSLVKHEEGKPGSYGESTGIRSELFFKKNDSTGRDSKIINMIWLFW